MIRRGLALFAGLAMLGTTSVAVASTNHQLRSDGHRIQQSHSATPHHKWRQLHSIRRATARFHDITVALDAGYVPFKDVNGISCIADMGMGGMGVHLVNPTLIGNPAIAPTAPEALVYAPERDGTLRLAALEYLVDKSAWDATHSARPEIFSGHRFDLTAAPNRFGLDTFYSQHVWAWKWNRAGLLSMWNPAVHCPKEM